MYPSDTICAIATATAPSGIGIIRISGKDAIAVTDTIFRAANHKKLSEAAAYTMHYGFIYDQDQMIDEVLVSVFRAPHSYTAEDSVEINCHGGPFILQKVLKLLTQKGIRIAEPGEFTKRAFLNGRLDLSEAEAVMDTISAQNEFALEASVKQLRGELSQLIRTLRQDILYEIAFIESALDDPEHISLEGYSEKLTEKCKALLSQVETLIASYQNGKIRKEGIYTVILGKPNAGKSSLLNLLLGENRAIVTDIAGTTRDVLEEDILLNGMQLHLVDTAGIHSSEDTIEQMGVEKAIEYANRADLILYLLDGSTPITEEDIRIARIVQDKKVMVLLNKKDLTQSIGEEDIKSILPRPVAILPISALKGEGMEEMAAILKDLFYEGEVTMNDQIYLTNLRHKQLMDQVKQSLLQVLHSLDQQMPEDFLSIDLMDAYKNLGFIIGEEIDDDLADEIFSKFCMGK
ncbi:MAG: tRNA uridine-5-carboxymethylaminomethyl(34) synthesis GTPase MnmE [Lachnospiraceae bacterium]|nr:tRNA uridine-5-carboxymethylaminomethyl(34) synthesis GTPase MnmE [Lachnospiraceae bacterium]